MSDDRSPFLKAAERLDRVVKVVKSEQRAAVGTPPEPADEEPALHPEEAWVRRFATHVLRPDLEIGAPPLSAFVAPLADVRAGRAPVPKPPAAPRLEASGHIGAGLGKVGPRRSWVARLFRGR
jgi:hypothetical protein